MSDKAEHRDIPDDNDAPPAVRKLYDDIRGTLATPIVNLVFRRLAGIDPELLRSVWLLLRPAYLDGSIGAHAAGLTTIVATDAEEVAARQAGPRLNRTDLATIKALIAFYNENNARNLVAFSALFGIDAGEVSAAPDPTSAVRRTMPVTPVANPPAVALPPLAPLASLPTSLRATVQRLNRFGDTGEPENPVASLYLHLAHWPAMLEFVEAVLAPLDAEGLLNRWRVAAQRGAVSPHLARLRAPVMLRPRIQPVLEPLVRCTLPKMVPIGFLLATLLAKPHTPGTT